MSAALLLLPWVGSTYDVPQLRQWRVSAERLSAGVLVGLDYPSPSHVAQLCTMLLEACETIQSDMRHKVTCGDALDLPEALSAFGATIEDLTKESADETERADALQKERDAFESKTEDLERERDSLEKQRDRAEERCQRLEQRLLDIRAILESEGADHG